MSNSVAKRLLAQQASGNLEQRQKAVVAAIALGMPLREIEEYLDWLDASRPQPASEDSPRNETGDATARPDLPAPRIAARKRKRRAPTQ